ncbi:MAG: hypothetical protein LAQ30_31710 [Acidobacteriia bacterium]|nr:hypothetical protein [Terriglobia bacterium]
MPQEIRAALEGFLQNARQPALYEPGEELLLLTGENFSLEVRGSRLTLQAWDRTRNITRRVVSVRKSENGRVELSVERFARREGQLVLVDLARRAGADASRRSGRLAFRERYRLFLRRQFPEWVLAGLSVEADLEHSLSPAFPRAFLRHGQHGWASMGCPPDGDPAAALSFGLIWLSYLRAREPRVVIEGLAVHLPAGQERAPALRVLCLDPSTARFELFSYTEDDDVALLDPHDYGNLDTRLEPARSRPEGCLTGFERLLSLPGVECIPRHPLYRQAPEAWLESQARAHIEILDASLRRAPIYGQTPVFTGGDRGVLDLLAVDHTGRLAILELKASPDLHLPMQALDYWVRVKWHLDRREFSAAGYFPGIELRPDPPRLLLVSPSLEFHPATETLLGYLSPGIDVLRIGVGVEWRKGLRVMFRLRGSERPH